MFQIGGAPANSARCKVCGVPITPVQAQTTGHCGSLPCMTKLTIERRAERDAKRREDWERISAAVMTESGLELAVVVPYQGDPLVPVPAERLAAFEANLREAVHIAFSDAPPEPDMDLADEVVETPTAVGIGGCTACQGMCCAQGNESKAFVGPRMMARQRLRYPAMEAEDMIQHYMDQIPELATEGGCVYQGHQGCVLSREDRARVCNSYKCWSLKKALVIEAENPGAEIAIAGSTFGQEIDNWLAVTASLEVPEVDLSEEEGLGPG